MSKLTEFEYGNDLLPVEFIETENVKDGVVCDVYEFIDDCDRDLGIISISAGKASPRQKVLMGNKTVEGHIAGKAKLVVEDKDGGLKEYLFPGPVTEISVNVGETMQWFADEDLRFYEICYPSYAAGRFEDLS